MTPTHLTAPHVQRLTQRIGALAVRAGDSLDGPDRVLYERAATQLDPALIGATCGWEPSDGILLSLLEGKVAILRDPA